MKRDRIILWAVLAAIVIATATAATGCKKKCYNNGWDDCYAGVYTPDPDCKDDYDEGWLDAGCGGGGDTGWDSGW
jgi:hypothetical protein